MAQYDRDKHGVRIEVVVESADLSDYRALTGDCSAIAVAINNVFGGTIVEVLDEEMMPRHAAVEIDGKLYDGVGVWEPREVVRYFRQLGDDREIKEPWTYIKEVDTIHEHFMCDEDIVVEAEQRLRAELERFS